MEIWQLKKPLKASNEVDLIFFKSIFIHTQRGNNNVLKGLLKQFLELVLISMIISIYYK